MERAAAKRPTEAGGMTLVYQDGRPHDCMLACVATLAGATLDEIPADCSPGCYATPASSGRIAFAWEEWLTARGLAQWVDAGRAPAFLDRWIAGVPVPASHAPFVGAGHAVVMCRDKILHDPGGWPKGSLDPRQCQESYIVGEPGWVAEQAHRMATLHWAGDPSVWTLNTPEGAMARHVADHIRQRQEAA